MWREGGYLNQDMISAIEIIINALCAFPHLQIKYSFLFALFSPPLFRNDSNKHWSLEALYLMIA